MAPSKSSVSLNFQRPEGRADFDRARRELKGALLDEGVEAGAQRLLEHGAALDTGAARCKAELIGSSLCWNDDNVALTAWIVRQHRALVEMGARMVEAMRRDPCEPSRVERVAALTLFHWGEAAKGSMWRERPDYRLLHDLLLLGVSAERRREPIAWVADGRGHTTSVEGLYFRALLLDRFSSGSLTRQQLELFDAWLWEWSAVLKGEREAPAGPLLRVDLDVDAGLRHGRREGAGASLHLALVPLEAERRKIVKSLHQGRIVPAHGCASEFRIEEQVALLGHLQRALRDPGDDVAQRAPRQAAAGARTEVWLGLQEILPRGIGVGIETGRWRALNLQDPAIAEQTAARFGEATRRYLWKVDSSATGLGFEALESDAAGIEVGDLLGWRNTTGGPVILGSVIRRMPSANRGQVFLGVELLTQAAQPIALSPLAPFDRAEADGTYLFVPGNDSSGRHDAFLVSESVYELRSTYRTQVGSNAFTVKLNRVRGRGRGWLLAGFEILPIRADGPSRELALGRPAPLELTLEEPRDSVEQAWDLELTSRLRG